jgi:hypothetical protein
LSGSVAQVEFITSASRKRWAHVCGDYCDDITAVLIQWNAPTPLEGTRFPVPSCTKIVVCPCAFLYMTPYIYMQDVCMSTHTYAHTHTHSHTHIYICIYIYTHINISIIVYCLEIYVIDGNWSGGRVWMALMWHVSCPSCLPRLRRWEQPLFDGEAISATIVVINYRLTVIKQMTLNLGMIRASQHLCTWAPFTDRGLLKLGTKCSNTSKTT